MIRRFPIGSKLILAALCLLVVVLPLAAQNLSLKEAKQLRDDAALAKKVSSNPEATAALERVIGKLDSMITKLEEKEADIYDNGKKYPPAAKVEIKAFDVPVGATEVHVPVTMDRQSPNTVIAHVRVFDGKGGRANPDKTKPVIFRPGDPLTKTASFKVHALKEGNDVRCNQPSVPDGAYRKGGSIRITAKEGAVNEPIEGGREPLTFEPIGKLTYSETGDTIKFDDKGGSMSFSTALSHGRTQVGNGETGYYGEVKYNGFKRTKEGLVLSSRRLAEPVKVGSPAIEYPFLAVMLSGHRTPETYFKHGTVEWVVKMPNRRDSWPALWLVPTGGWPPEIDVYEGFGYNGSWRFHASLSTNLHGGDRNVRTFTRPAMRMKMSDFGLPNTLDSEFHTFAVTVTAEWITMFIDGVETMQYANPFDGEQWYPLTNVAVKAGVDSSYDKGSGDMVVKSIKVWRVD
ncbi:MAG: beta-glucanase [Phycisphaeraceae bacterium]|nr:beta-glucanase [Phycisphaeraceae bacterium]